MVYIRKLQREVSRSMEKRLNNRRRENSKHLALRLVKEELQHHAAAAETERELLARIRDIREKRAVGQLEP